MTTTTTNSSKFIELIELDSPTLKQLNDHELFSCTAEAIRIFQGRSSEEDELIEKDNLMEKNDSGNGLVARVRRLTLRSNNSSVRPTFKTTKSENHVVTLNRPFLNVTDGSGERRRRSFHGEVIEEKLEDEERIEEVEEGKENLERGPARLKKKVRHSTGGSGSIPPFRKIESTENKIEGEKKVEGKRRTMRISFSGIERGWTSRLTGLLSPNKTPLPSSAPASIPPLLISPSLANSRNPSTTTTTTTTTNVIISPMSHSIGSNDLFWDSIERPKTEEGELDDKSSFEIKRPRRIPIRSVSEPIVPSTATRTRPIVSDCMTPSTTINLKGIIESIEKSNSTCTLSTTPSFTLTIDPIDLIDNKRLSKLKIKNLILDQEAIDEIPRLSWSCSSAEERESSEDSEGF